MEDIIALEFKDRIAFLTLCDTKGLNLENLEMVKVLAEKQEEIDRNKEIRAVVVQSSVKNFSAGCGLTFLQD
jgi:enoyl-CoA hydratase/carnithine racemase